MMTAQSNDSRLAILKNFMMRVGKTFILASKMFSILSKFT